MNLRLLALGGAVACAIALPLAMASAGPAGDEARSAAALPAAARPPSAADGAGPGPRAGSDAGVGHGTDVGHSTDARGRTPARGRTDSGGGTDPKAPPAAPSRSPLLLGLGLATAARCGPELTSPEGAEAQTCVLTQGEDTWARTYYRNATGRALDAFLSLMGPAGRTVQVRCAVGAEDEPESCETPRGRTRGELDAYTAVAEFSASAGTAGDGPLLLRSGSNSESNSGSTSGVNSATDGGS
ncbi:hypothetical protein OG562_20745 [Streptomyces sp. NBC_01275]|uniref:hypothetical protein n=1 Tax=Streptomyces sp. NBC_01275 TaxID=2903807 RepID=UPI002258D1CB|nr:hypothetical protein [Streptomyces sp. NBC_01275]MCX4763351.1 hypothetical protein [Streptomyces sp. NBC_01275]